MTERSVQSTAAHEFATPLMRQYGAIKKQHPNTLVFFRLGDFYELFFEDAVLASRELQITLTSRNKEKGAAVPMCGVPYHSAESYIQKLVRKGYKVAICEQMEDPKLAKKLVRREVTHVLTPGTAAGALLPSEENNFLAAISRGAVQTLAMTGTGAGQETTVGFAALDLSTGEFRATEFRGEDAERRVSEELQHLRPREVLFASSLPLFPGRSPVLQELMSSPTPPALTPVEDWVFSPDYAIPLVENQFGVLSLEGFGLAGRRAAASAAGAILHYVRATQRGGLQHLDRIGYYERQNCLVLDAVTVRNLELVEPLFASSDDSATLFRCLDATLTPMGKRLLRQWMLRPASEGGEIEARLESVAAMAGDLIAREELRRSLDGVMDLERLLSRITLETANPRDVLALAASLGRAELVQAAALKFPSPRMQELAGQVNGLPELQKRIYQTLVPEPPLAFAEGGVIREGVDPALDELRDLSRNSKQYIARIEERERQRTGIGSLKVKFNSVFGYYIEITKANLHLAAPDYERKQTLVNAERFTTLELKEYETRVLDAQEKIAELERRLFHELRSAVTAVARAIRQTAMAVAQADVLACFAHLAASRQYCRPQFSASGELEIIDGRHPVVEQQELSAGTERFVPNDLYMNCSTHSVLLITGPNMGGKSTFLRQAALIVLMAQIGCFVPARAARLSIVDRIFTRIGASDSLARGRSTFMVEMTETAAILNTATPQSLILLDEIGRGTATFDGLAIAWATVEYVHSRTRAKTLFATHYHELTELANRLSGVKNFRVSVKETGENIVFLRKVEPGAADRSYGIEVAKLAGLPPAVIQRAREVLAEHESAERELSAHLESAAEARVPSAQLTIFTPLSQKIVDRLRETDLNTLTPLEALNLLHALKQQIE
ncbi:MAG: DNA mismatch repair protein MutS [Acidobacteria bacterium]|nr:DNA mismatch repair protein MutS [Acidobacteriota bacterium]